MALQAVISKLRSPVKEIVSSATAKDATLAGKIEKDQAEVVQWIERASQDDLTKEDNLKNLDKELVPKTYVVSNYLTAADIALFGFLHPEISKLLPTKCFAYPSLTRYFDHIQSSSPVRTAADDANVFPFVSIDLVNAPALDRTVEPTKKKEKAPKPAPTPEVAATPAQPTSEAPQPQKTQKKEKKEKSAKESGAAEEGGKKKAGGAPKGAATAEDGEPVPSMIDLRVGHIIDVKKHPDADGLYVEQIDIGEETGPRTVVSGLVNYIPIEQMRDKYLIAVCNLKPATMRGVKSFAMVLCATSKEGKEGGIEIVQPPPNAKPGDRVYFEGFEDGSPLSQLNPKKKIFEAIQPGFTTLETREAAWVNPNTKQVHRIRTSDGVCLAPTFVGASLS